MKESVGRYRLLRSVDQNNTYAAFDPMIQREVTLRLFEVPQMAGREPTHYLRDLLALAKLDHLHLLPIYDTGEDAGTIYIVLKQLDASDEGTTILSGYEAIGSGLDYLYETGYNPTEITPSDLLRDSLGRPVLDYISQSFFYYNFIYPYQNTRDQETDTAFQLPHRFPFMSPEQQALEPIDRAAYTFSLVKNVKNAVEAGGVNGNNRDQWGLFFEKGLHQDPAQRFLNGAEIIAGLDYLLGSAEVETAAPVSPAAENIPDQQDDDDDSKAAETPIADASTDEPPPDEATTETVQPEETIDEAPEIVEQVGSETRDRAFPWAGLLIPLLLIVGGLIFYQSYVNLSGQAISPTATVNVIAAATDLPTDSPPATQAPVPQSTETLTSIPTTTTDPISELSVSPANSPTPSPTETATETPAPTETNTPTSSPTSTETLTPTASPTSISFFIVEPSSINLRGGPSPEYESVGFAYGEERLQILAKTPDEAWLNVRAEDGTTGWVNQLLGEIIPNNDLSNLPLAVTLPPPSESTP